VSVEIIAEIGQAHEGSLGILHSYIDALAEVGVDTIKFQTHIAEAESSAEEPFRVNFSYEDATRYDYWRRMEFTPEQWRGIKKHCDDLGVTFLSSPFSLAAVDLLEELGVARYKIGSGEVTNLLMLDKIARTGKDIILSSGMSSYDEIHATLTHLQQYDIGVSLMQCTTKYPTAPEDLGLHVISALRERYAIPIGFSDHSGEIFSALAAVSLGAKLVEVHAVFDKRMFGPDSSSSLDMAQMRELVRGVRFISKSLTSPVDKSSSEEFATVKHIFEKSLALNKDKRAGDIITFDDLEAKKPAGCGVAAREYKSVVGKAVTQDMSKWSFITEDMVR
jgi:N-acetylneuraminate synthase